VAVSLVLLALYYHSVYGVIYPVWDHPGKTMAATVGLQGGFLGLLFHRTNGLVPFWPVAGFAIAGLALMLRDGKRAAPWLIAFVALQWLVVGSFGAWTGGRCPPLRHWLPAMPLLIVGSICALARMRRRWLVGLMGAAMVLAVVIGARNVSHPRELFKEALPLTPNPGTFAVRQIEQFYGIFPNMREPTMTDHVLGVAWLVVLVAFVVVVVWLEKGGQRSRNVVKETVGFAGDEP